MSAEHWQGPPVSPQVSPAQQIDCEQHEQSASTVWQQAGWAESRADEQQASLGVGVHRQRADASAGSAKAKQVNATMQRVGASMQEV